MERNNDVKRICLWSGPRNISTALMYAFAQRSDTRVCDEPLYGYYLKHYPKAQQYHPASAQIIDKMECDGHKVIKTMLNAKTKPVLFFKHMIHHLLDLDRSFMKQTINVILTRHPEEMLPSFHKVIKNPSLNDVGYQLQFGLMDYFKKQHIPFMVLDSKTILINPNKMLSKLCDFIGIPFDKTMLSWKAGPLNEDGIWAKYWYSSVHNSEGFIPYNEKKEQIPQALKPLLRTCLPYYKALVSDSDKLLKEL